MSRWADRILADFIPDLSPKWVVLDPDDVLPGAETLAELRARGFMILDHSDPFTFRAEYETLYRAARDRGEHVPSLIVHTRESSPDELPWDVTREARVVRLGLADLFPRLSYKALKDLDKDLLPALYCSHEDELQSPRGELESLDFILEKAHGLALGAIRSESDFWRELSRMHFSGRAPAQSCAARAASIIKGKGILPDMPLEQWIASRGDFLRVVEDAWRVFLLAAGVECRPPSSERLPAIPFGHSDVLFFTDSLFLVGALRPVLVSFLPPDLPAWVRTGIVRDPESEVRSVADGARALLAEIPGPGAGHKEWGACAWRMARLSKRAGDLPPKELHGCSRELEELALKADGELLEWVMSGRYSDLILQPAVTTAPMVHHVPSLMRRDRDAHGKSALIVMDGMAIDQWLLIRDTMEEEGSAFSYDESTTFAWLPTTTAVSRQAIFSGRKPRDFAESIDRSDKEEALWRSYWRDEGVRPDRVYYRRGLRDHEGLSALEEELDAKRPEIVGLVVDEVDSRMHHERDRASIALNLRAWTRGGVPARLIRLLLDRGYKVRITADHGNTTARGIGKPKEGDVPEERGERARIYRSRALLDAAAARIPSAFPYENPGLPDSFMVLFARSGTAFVNEGESLVAHGGPSVSELIVPLIKVEHEKQQ